MLYISGKDLLEELLMQSLNNDLTNINPTNYYMYKSYYDKVIDNTTEVIKLLPDEIDHLKGLYSESSGSPKTYKIIIEFKNSNNYLKLVVGFNILETLSEVKGQVYRTFKVFDNTAQFQEQLIIIKDHIDRIKESFLNIENK